MAFIKPIKKLGFKPEVHRHGSNGRWRAVLTADELATYDEHIAKTLTPECARWLEKGGSY